MHQACRLYLGAFIVMAVGVTSASGVHLKGSIIRIGFQGSSISKSSRGEDHFRQDSWVPVRVELGNEDGDHFTGTLEIRQKDRDGDEVAAQWPIAIRDEYRRFYLYVPGGMSGVDWSVNPQSFRVRIYDDQGGFAPLFDENEQPIDYLEPPRSLRGLTAATRVILDISERPVNHLGILPTLPDLTQEVAVLRLDPKELPDNAAGLAMVDIIVWDGGDPTIFDDPARRDALVEWVRQGGTLVIGVGTNWNRLRNSPQFKDILPANLQETLSITEPTRAITKALDIELELIRPITLCRVTPGDLAPDAYAAMPSDPAGDEPILVARRLVDRGIVTLVTAEINDLLEQGLINESFLQELLLQRTYSRSTEPNVYGRRNLFEQVESLIGFATDTVLYFFFAFIFVIGYILVATAGIWFGLKRRGMVQHTWTAFALITMATSGLSLAAVRFVRGIGSTVQEVQIVDLQAGQSLASAECFFGLKTATHIRQDLKLPKDPIAPEESASLPGALRPLPCDLMDQMVMQKTYSNTLRYNALAGVGQLANVPFRATLKKLQGNWRGEIEGSVLASLRTEAGSRLTNDSWIQNQLGTQLGDSYLFVAARNPDAAILPRIYVYPIGELDSNDRILIAEVYDRMTQKTVMARDQELGRIWRPEVLSDQLSSWLNNVGFRPMTGYPFGDTGTRKVKVDEKSVVSALHLLTFYNEIAPDELARRGVVRPAASNLDCSDRISADRALFVGFSREPGPARLFGRDSDRERDDWDAYSVSNALVMYRVWIPVK